MEQYFSPIQDASRLQAGDIIVVPSEVNRKRKRFHMSLGSLSSIGVSSGHTCRSRNTSSAVENLLVRDPGVPRVLIVASVYHGCNYPGSIESVLMPFIGNCVTAQPRLPVIDSATICDLPYDDKCSRYSRLSYISSMGEYVQNVLLDKISNKLFFHAAHPDYGRGETEDQCIADVYDSRHAHDDYEERCIQDEIPNGQPRDPDAKMSREEIATFIFRSNIFSRGAASVATEAGEIVESVVAQKKFFVEYARRGAMFYRPSHKVLEAIAARSLVESFAEYSKKCEEINAAANRFMCKLEKGMANVAGKIKEAKELEAYLAKCGADEAIMNQLKEIVG